jgi:integrase
MPNFHISKRTVDSAQPSNRDVLLWDDELPGFGLKITPRGRKVYLVQYRLGGRKGRTRRVTIGVHGRITPDQARQEAKRLLGLVATGVDPAEQRQQDKGQPTVETLLELFLSQHVATKLKDNTAASYRRLCRLHLPHRMRTMRAVDVDRRQVTRLHHDMGSKPYAANALLAVLSKFFNWCEKHGYRPDGSNPCRHVEKYKEQKRERFLSEEEMARLGEALTNAEENKTASPWTIAAIRLLVLTGARLSEILTLKWSYVDLSRGTIRLPDSKTGAKTIYLNAAAVEVLSNVPRLENNLYVICGEKPGAHLVNLQKPWRRIRKAAGLDDLRIHDLRHSFASVAAAGGMSLPMIGALLGHSQPATTARYAHLASDPLRAASESIGGRIAGSMGMRNKDQIAGQDE